MLYALACCGAGWVGVHFQHGDVEVDDRDGPAAARNPLCSSRRRGMGDTACMAGCASVEVNDERVYGRGAISGGLAVFSRRVSSKSPADAQHGSGEQSTSSTHETAATHLAVPLSRLKLSVCTDSSLCGQLQEAGTAGVRLEAACYGGMARGARNAL